MGKRRRPAHSCVECRRRKVRCDRANPCSQCVRHHEPSCTYTEKRHVVSNLEPLTTESNQQEETTRSLDSPHSGNITPPTSAPLGKIVGTQSKTRVFGHGHWMSTMPLASHCPYLYLSASPFLTSCIRPPNCPSSDQLRSIRIHCSSQQIMPLKILLRAKWHGARC